MGTNCDENAAAPVAEKKNLGWRDTRNEFATSARSTRWSLPVKKERPCYQLEGPTSPRIVTSKEHSKTYVDEVLYIHS